MRKLFAIITAVMLLTCSAIAETEICVSGEGTVIVPAEVAVIRLGVQKDAETAEAAQADVNEKLASIRSTFEMIGITQDDISTDSINVSTIYNNDYEFVPENVYDADEGPEYRASTTLAIRTENMDTIGDVIDAAITAGADCVNGITFSLKDPSIYNETVLAKACAAARAKADILANNLGVRIKDVKNVTESYSSVYESDSATFADKAISESESTTMVDTTNVEVSVTITITYIAE